jgi:hypothetical protein
MRYCSNCGHQVSEDMRFCTECGQKLMEPTRKTQPRSAYKLFNYANERWHQRQRFLLDGDEEKARKACVEVIRLCQLSIEADRRIGDAYVMLANALSVAASRVPRNLDRESYEFLLSRAAAVIHFWYSLPHRGYPTTKNTAIAEQLWRSIFDGVKEHKALPEDAALALMNSYRDSFAADTISTSSFDELERVISNQPLVMPPPTAMVTAESIPAPEVSKAEILEEICQLEGMIGIWVRGVSRLSYAESNIIYRKVNPLRRHPLKPFPVMEEANEEEINKWLNHPLINVPLPDDIVMVMAAQTPIPVATMERMLRKLLQDDYDGYWRMAEAQVMSKK